MSEASRALVETNALSAAGDQESAEDDSEAESEVHRGHTFDQSSQRKSMDVEGDQAPSSTTEAVQGSTTDAPRQQPEQDQPESRTILDRQPLFDEGRTDRRRAGSSALSATSSPSARISPPQDVQGDAGLTEASVTIDRDH